jgi:hypothetical protein
MEHCSRPGTGESWCSTSMATRVELLNTEIAHEECRNFLQLLIDQGVIPQVRLFFGREKERRYGTAWIGRKEIILNRRCVEVFLHETAHFVCAYHYKDKDSHGPCFARCLDRLIYMWLYKETKF